MRRKYPVLVLAVLVLVLTGCSFGLSMAPTLMPSSVPPVLPDYSTPNPSPTFAPIHNLNPGDSITITDGSGKLLWLEYLGNVAGYDHWSCVSNDPEKGDCQSPDSEVHQTLFYWGRELVASNSDGGGDITLYDGWHLTVSAQAPAMP